MTGVVGYNVLTNRGRVSEARRRAAPGVTREDSEINCGGGPAVPAVKILRGKTLIMNSNQIPRDSDALIALVEAAIAGIVNHGSELPLPVDIVTKFQAERDAFRTAENVYLDSRADLAVRLTRRRNAYTAARQ